MPNDGKGANARRSVTRLLLEFIAATKREFSTPPATLLRLAEERASKLTEDERRHDAEQSLDRLESPSVKRERQASGAL